MPRHSNITVTSIELPHKRTKRIALAFKMGSLASAMVVMLYLKLVNDNKITIPSLLFISNLVIFTKLANRFLVHQDMQRVKFFTDNPQALVQLGSPCERLVQRRKQVSMLVSTLPGLAVALLYNRLMQDNNIIVPGLILLITMALLTPKIDRALATTMGPHCHQHTHAKLS